MSAPSNEKKFGISVIPGDGIGNEVVPEGLRVLEAVGKKYGFDYGFDYDYGLYVEFYLEVIPHVIFFLIYISNLYYFFF